MQILLVDDDTAASSILAEILESSGYYVKTARNGIEALDIISTEHFDAVISDLMMGGMDGFTLCRTLKNDGVHNDLPVIFLTAHYTDELDEEFAISVGASKLLRKPADKQVILDALREVLHLPADSHSDNGTKTQLTENEYLREYNAVLMHNLEKKVLELQKLHRELVEEHFKTEQERRKYAQLFKYANDGIILFRNSDGVILESNPRALEILGFSENELVGSRLSDLKPFGEAILFRIEGKAPFEFESTYQKGNHEVYLDLSCSSIGVDGSVSLVILHDTTRRKEILDRFMLSDKMRALGNLSFGLAHEIRNPLSAISMNLELLSRSYPQGSPDARLVSSALDGVKMIEKVLSETLDFARPGDSHKSKVKLSYLVYEVKNLLKTTLQKNRIRSSIFFHGSDDMVNVDRTQVVHALLNISQNAIEAMPNGGELSFSLICKRELNEITLIIKDTGIGMSQDVLGHCMEPLFSVKANAIGMGLSIAQRLLEQNDATITIKSKENEGTAVSIHFRALHESDKL
ncbi:MAG: response regulator [Candidatus Kryptoniota bacterium]